MFAESMQFGAANDQALTPVQFIQRNALAFPTRTAVIYGNSLFSWSQHYVT